jgi:hypothetical protein
MSEFIFVYRGRLPTASAEQRQQHTQKWLAWFKELGAQGYVKDIGRPLENGGKVVTGRQKAIQDGPYAEAKDVIGGFSIIEADDLDEAAELSKGCPILEVGGSVEVRPVQVLNM